MLDVPSGTGSAGWRWRTASEPLAAVAYDAVDRRSETQVPRQCNRQAEDQKGYSSASHSSAPSKFDLFLAEEEKLTQHTACRGNLAAVMWLWPQPA